MYQEIAADSWIYQVATLINFITTLAIFPGSTVLIEPQYPTGELKQAMIKLQEMAFFNSLYGS